MESGRDRGDNARTKKKPGRSCAHAASDNRGTATSTKLFRSRPAKPRCPYLPLETMVHPASVPDQRDESPSPTAGTARHNPPATCTAHQLPRPFQRRRWDNRASLNIQSPPQRCQACRTASPPAPSPEARASHRWCRKDRTPPEPAWLIPDLTPDATDQPKMNKCSSAPDPACAARCRETCHLL